jgi:hypothetical protein
MTSSLEQEEGTHTAQCMRVEFLIYSTRETQGKKIELALSTKNCVRFGVLFRFSLSGQFLGASAE